MPDELPDMLTRRATDVGGDAPGALDFSSLDGALKDARVVMLGEQNHGDGGAFKLKTELVKHLHLHHGFDVLVFEADFFSVNRAWEAVEAVEGVRRGVASTLYPFWATTQEVQPLWDFVEARYMSERPLIISGIDPRHRRSCDLLGAFERFARNVQFELPSIDGYEVFRSLLGDLLLREYEHKVSAFERERFFAVLRELLRLIDGQARDVNFWRQELRNLGFAAHNAWSFERRDEGMASNLLWLARERHPDSKLIVWAHNYHIAKSSRLVMDQASPLDIPHPHDTLLGEVVAQALGDAVYVLGIVSGGGSYSPYAYRGDFTTTEPTAAPAPDSLEERLCAAGFARAFIDLRNAPTSGQAFVMSGVEHNHPKLLPWSEVFDGMVFMREMTGLNVS